MHRTQILLDKWQYEMLKAMAESQGKSLSSLVREAVSAFLDNAKRRQAGLRLADIEGIAEDQDVTGRDHDRMLYGPEGRRS